MDNKQKKRISIGKIVFITIGVILVLISMFLGGLITVLVVKYNQVSYEYEPPVEREETYVMPDYPEIIVDNEGTWQEGMDETAEDTESAETEAETVPPSAETEIEPEPAVETVTETEQETESAAQELVEVIDPNQQRDPGEDITVSVPAQKPAETKKPQTPEAADPAPETVAPVVNAPAAEQVYTAPSNPDASFANSPNAVSVYGKVPIYKVDQKDEDIFNILVMGTDSRDITADRGRSDAMIIVSYNKKDGSIKLTSLLRDSLVPIAGHDWNRINTAYFFGGVGLAINTVNDLYNLDIQNFVVFDLNGVEDFIDYIGGVDVTLTQEEVDLYKLYGWGKDLTAGENHLSGKYALNHMRNRTIGSDFARTQRQRDTIVAVMTKILTQKSLTEIYDIVDYAFGLVKTNMSAKTLASHAASLLGNVSKLSIESQNVPYADSYKNAWYNGMAILSFNISDAAKRINSFIYD